MRVLAVLLVAVTVLVLLPTDRAQEQAVLSADPSQDSGEAEASSRRREKSTRDTSRSDVENLTTFALIDYLQRKGYEIDASNANYEDLLEFALSIDDRALEELSSNIELVSSDEEQDTANDSDVEKIEQAVGQDPVNNPLLPKELPDDATFWELLKEQVRHDFAPILILLPAPFKRFAAEKLAQLASQVFKFGYGAIEPMIAPFCFLLNIAGGVVRAAGENILDLSETIKTFKESRQQSSTTKEGQLKTNSVLTQDDGEHSPFDSEEIRDNSSQERETEVSPAWVGKANSFTEQDVETGEVIEL